jgi:RNA-directed DNA polymerase
VVETDIASCFSAIPHGKLIEAVEERVCDQPVLKLLRAMLRAGVMQDGQVQPTVAGTPQGGVFSPVMCNVYLHRLDRAWDDGDGVLVRFADDLVVMCWSRSQARIDGDLTHEASTSRSRGGTSTFTVNAINHRP